MSRKSYFIENLDRAIEEKWIRVYYQPIVRSTNGKICGQEAFSRWVEPNGDICFPDELVPCLEEAGLISRLDLYVVEQVLAKMKRTAILTHFILKILHPAGVLEH